MKINVTDCVINDFKRRVEFINAIKDTLNQLCVTTKDDDNFRLMKSDYTDTFIVKIQYEEYDVTTSITYQEVYDYILNKDEIERGIRELIISKIYKELREQLDSTANEMPAKMMQLV